MDNTTIYEIHYGRLYEHLYDHLCDHNCEHLDEHRAEERKRLRGASTLARLRSFLMNGRHCLTMRSQRCSQRASLRCPYDIISNLCTSAFSHINKETNNGMYSPIHIYICIYPFIHFFVYSIWITQLFTKSNTNAFTTTLVTTTRTP